MKYKILQSIGGLVHSIINLFLTRQCVVCGRELLQFEKQLCLTCLAEMPLTYFWKFKENAADAVFWGRTKIERAYPLMFFRNDYKKCLYNFKYKGDIKLGFFLGEMLGGNIKKNLYSQDEIDCIIPVPLHWRKQIKRGFNQAEIIARGIAHGYTKISRLYGTKAPLVRTHIISRKRFTKTQTQKDRLSRWRNVEDAFKISDRNLGRTLRSADTIHFLVVDDVLTTGATLEACAEILIKACKAAGKQCKVSVATLACVE